MTQESDGVLDADSTRIFLRCLAMIILVLTFIYCTKELITKLSIRFKQRAWERNLQERNRDKVLYEAKWDKKWYEIQYDTLKIWVEGNEKFSRVVQASQPNLCVPVAVTKILTQGVKICETMLSEH